MTISPKTLASSFVLTVALTGMSSQALAGTSYRTFMESVPFTQQELTTTQGVANVHKRIIKAARHICVGNGITSRNLLSSKIVEDCAAGIANRALAPSKYEIIASFHNSLDNPGYTGSNRFAKSDWTVEKFKMAQMMDAPQVNALP